MKSTGSSPERALGHIDMPLEQGGDGVSPAMIAREPVR
jgi:hypothetical protein